MLVRKGLQVDTPNNVNVMLWMINLSITKGNSFYIMHKRVLVLVHCTSPHRDLLTMKFQVDISYVFVLCSVQNTSMKNNKGQ